MRVPSKIQSEGKYCIKVFHIESKDDYRGSDCLPFTTHARPPPPSQPRKMEKSLQQIYPALQNRKINHRNTLSVLFSEICIPEKSFIYVPEQTTKGEGLDTNLWRMEITLFQSGTTITLS